MWPIPGPEAGGEMVCVTLRTQHGQHGLSSVERGYKQNLTGPALPFRDFETTVRQNYKYQLYHVKRLKSLEGRTLMAIALERYR